VAPALWHARCGEVLHELTCVLCLQRLAAAYPAAEIGTVAYRLFTQFRPAVPPGPAGSGRAQKGLLRLERVRELASMVRRA
jgi:hypothetical protein